MTTPKTTPLADLPGCWRDVTVALTGGIDRLLLYGVPGTGKTFGGLHIGVSDDAPRSHRLVCTEDMTSADVTGAWMPDAAGTFRWLDGAATLAWIGDGPGYHTTRHAMSTVAVWRQVPQRSGAT